MKINDNMNQEEKTKSHRRFNFVSAFALIEGAGTVDNVEKMGE